MAVVETPVMEEVTPSNQGPATEGDDPSNQDLVTKHTDDDGATSHNGDHSHKVGATTPTDTSDYVAKQNWKLAGVGNHIANT